MEDWMQDGGYLERLRETGSRLVQGCQSVLASRPCQEQDDSAGQQAGAGRLTRAIEELRELLQQVPVPLTLQPPGPSTQLAAAQRSSDAAPAAAARTTLLHLPDDLLRRVGRLMGPHARAVCSRLREAYGPPGLCLEDLDCDLTAEHHWELEDWNESSAEIMKRILRLVVSKHNYSYSLRALTTCGARWPGWAAQVTRLELSDAVTLDAPRLQLIKDTLPGLRQLGCGCMSTYSSAHDGELPQLPMLTALCMLSGCNDVVNAMGCATFELLSVAPNLQRLHLDLQRLSLSTNSALRMALQPLAQLTHLELLCGPHSVWEGGERLSEAYRNEVLGALGSLAGRLRSLVFLSPTADLGPRTLQTLQALTNLSTLGWCSGWGSNSFDTAPHGCLSLGSRLQELVVGPASANGAFMFAYAAGNLANAFIASDAAPSAAFVALALPVLEINGGSAEDMHEGLLGLQQQFAANVANSCPGLTSLHMGVHVSLDNASVPLADDAPSDLLLWLQPVCRLRQLRQLVLKLSMGNPATLTCLADLPALSELWLEFDDSVYSCRHMQAAGEPQRALSSALSQLTSLKQLAVSIQTSANCSCYMVPAVVSAAASLPQLRVLSISACLLLHGIEEPWLPLLASPPPHLREVRLGCPSGYTDSNGWPVVHRSLEAFLSRHLPQHVAVVATPPRTFGPAWGPRACCLADMSMRWQRLWF